MPLCNVRIKSVLCAEAEAASEAISIPLDWERKALLYSFPYKGVLCGFPYRAPHSAGNFDAEAFAVLAGICVRHDRPNDRPAKADRAESAPVFRGLEMCRTGQTRSSRPPNLHEFSMKNHACKPAASLRALEKCQVFLRKNLTLLSWQRATRVSGSQPGIVSSFGPRPVELGDQSASYWIFAIDHLSAFCDR
jgi:hypothetical protein